MKKILSKENLIELLKDKNSKRKLIAAFAIIGVALIFLSEIGTQKNGSDNSRFAETSCINYSEYVEDLNERLSDIIGKIDGVGECSVMITMQNTQESVYAENKENSQNGSSVSENSEYVIYDGESGDSPLLINEKMPGVAGVAVVCSGGDNVLVREKIISCVCALFNIPSSRVSVSKLNSKGGN